MLLSACLIVKNEETYIYNCLNSIKNFVDEIVLVDTGSTDNTVEIAKNFTDKIYHYEWNDDFSAARNFSISKANSDWIFIIDGDEIFTADPNKLRKFLKTSIDIDAIYAYSKNISVDSIDTDVLIPRFIKREKAKYKNRIHNQLISKGLKTITLNEVVINHYGYIFSPYKIKKKVSQRINMMNLHLASLKDKKDTDIEKVYYNLQKTSYLIKEKNYSELFKLTDYILSKKIYLINHVIVLNSCINLSNFYLELGMNDLALKLINNLTYPKNEKYYFILFKILKILPNEINNYLNYIYDFFDNKNYKGLNSTFKNTVNTDALNILAKELLTLAFSKEIIDYPTFTKYLNKKRSNFSIEKLYSKTEKNYYLKIFENSLNAMEESVEQWGISYFINLYDTLIMNELYKEAAKLSKYLVKSKNTYLSFLGNLFLANTYAFFLKMPKKAKTILRSMFDTYGNLKNKLFLFFYEIPENDYETYFNFVRKNIFNYLNDLPTYSEINSDLENLSYGFTYFNLTSKTKDNYELQWNLIKNNKDILFKYWDWYEIYTFIKNILQKAIKDTKFELAYEILFDDLFIESNYNICTENNMIPIKNKLELYNRNKVFNSNDKIVNLIYKEQVNSFQLDFEILRKNKNIYNEFLMKKTIKNLL